jgi:hypothetical protein
MRDAPEAEVLRISQALLDESVCECQVVWSGTPAKVALDRLHEGGAITGGATEVSEGNPVSVGREKPRVIAKDVTDH